VVDKYLIEHRKRTLLFDLARPEHHREIPTWTKGRDPVGKGDVRIGKLLEPEDGDHTGT
jgi:hypothetical protein